MYTRCPYCHTTFGVSAAQLRAAHGQVRCGTCKAVFDGVDCLIDDIETNGAALRPAAGPARFEAGATQYVHGGKAGDADDAHRIPGADAPPELAAGAPAAKDDVPEVLKEDIARSGKSAHPGVGSVMMTILALVLLAGLGAQFAWFRPARVLAAYPQARPWLETFCTATGCALPDRRDPAKIQMLARDVRVHPTYEGALLVSATLINVAAHAQPYPRLRFSVFNVNGQTIASRTFEPEEYLSPDLDSTGEMLPGKPLQIAVELIAPEEAAVSYEFRFL